jgi:hypothetical protein
LAYRGRRYAVDELFQRLAARPASDEDVDARERCRGDPVEAAQIHEQLDAIVRARTGTLTGVARTGERC